MSRRGVPNQTSKSPIRRIGIKVKEIKVETMVITAERVIMSKMGIITTKTTSIEVTMITEMIGVGPMSLPKIVKLPLGIVEIL